MQTLARQQRFYGGIENPAGPCDRSNRVQKYLSEGSANMKEEVEDVQRTPNGASHSSNKLNRTKSAMNGNRSHLDAMAVHFKDHCVQICMSRYPPKL